MNIKQRLDKLETRKPRQRVHVIVLKPEDDRARLPEHVADDDLVIYVSFHSPESA